MIMLRRPPAGQVLLAALFAMVSGCTSVDDKPGGGRAGAGDRPAGETRAGRRPLTEKEKIEALIKHVEGMEGAVFVRNGKEYDAPTAARFLRGKWERARDVKTAREFIEQCATTSSTSGKPYLIRLKGGKEVKSGEYLTAELKKLEEAEGGKM
jgi:hypothetical protein